MVEQVKPTERDELLAKQLDFLFAAGLPAVVKILVTEPPSIAYALKVRDNEVLLATEQPPDLHFKMWYRLDEIELYEPEYD